MHIKASSKYIKKPQLLLFASSFMFCINIPNPANNIPDAMPNILPRFIFALISGTACNKIIIMPIKTKIIFIYAPLCNIYN